MFIHLTQASIYNTGGGSSSMYREGGPRIVLFGHRHAHTLGPPEMVAMYAPRAADIEQDKVKRVPMGQMGTARYVHDNGSTTMAWPLASCPTCLPRQPCESDI